MKRIVVLLALAVMATGCDFADRIAGSRRLVEISKNRPTPCFTVTITFDTTRTTGTTGDTVGVKPCPK